MGLLFDVGSGNYRILKVTFIPTVPPHMVSKHSAEKKALCWIKMLKICNSGGTKTKMTDSGSTCKMVRLSGLELSGFLTVSVFLVEHNVLLTHL